MGKRLKRVLQYTALVLLLYFVVILVHGYASDWQPGPEPTALDIQGTAPAAMLTDSNISVVIWNVGYGGLGAESDFSYDDEGLLYAANSMVRSPRHLVDKNLQGTVDFLKNTRADFFLLQEADVASDRSYQIPQYDRYREALPGFAATMALNYNCGRVPIPLLQPWKAYGEVRSGLATFCKYQPKEATRYQLPGQYPMPDRMFQLDRCAALHRIPTAGGKDLVLINVHNSAYDPGDKIKAIQLPYLRDLAVKEYEKGNYVVLGGDWNQCPPHFRFDIFAPQAAKGYEQGNVPVDFFPEDWAYGYDPTVPTNRKARDPYKKGETFETLIDFFLVSPNVTIRTVKGLNMAFALSDHQPVYIELSLR
jgi:endonuclease/exonuclease/phosphatase family metal-dependent hydrolase